MILVDTALRSIGFWSDEDLGVRFIGSGEGIGYEPPATKRAKPIKPGAQPHDFANDNYRRCLGRRRGADDFGQSRDQDLLLGCAGIADDGDRLVSPAPADD